MSPHPGRETNTECGEWVRRRLEETVSSATGPVLPAPEGSETPETSGTPSALGFPLSGNTQGLRPNLSHNAPSRAGASGVQKNSLVRGRPTPRKACLL